MKYNKGFSKYSLESIENDNMSLLNHSENLDITWRTRKFGNIEFDASYKF